MTGSFKKCGQCGQDLPLEKFFKNKAKRDGLADSCRACYAKRHQARKARLATECGGCGKVVTPGYSYCQKCSRRGDRSHKWRGGRSVNKSGYVDLSGHFDHPNARRGKLQEHVLIMSEHLGRPMLAGEEVHHKNGVRDDNRIENLELWSTSQPKGQRVEDKVAWAIELLKTYKPEALA